MVYNKFISVLKKILLFLKCDEHWFVAFFIALIGLSIGSMFFLSSISKAIPIYNNNILVKILVVDWSRQAYILFWGIIWFIIAIVTMIIVITDVFPIKFRSGPIKETIKKTLLIVFVPPLVVVVSIGIFDWVVNYSYKKEITYDKENNSIVSVNSYLVPQKKSRLNTPLKESYWIEMNHYDDDQIGSDKGPPIGRCGLFSDDRQGPILFEGKPSLALQISKFLNEMTGLCLLKKNWYGRKMTSCEILNSGVHANCHCNNNK